MVYHDVEAKINNKKHPKTTRLNEYHGIKIMRIKSKNTSPAPTHPTIISTSETTIPNAFTPAAPLYQK